MRLKLYNESKPFSCLSFKPLPFALVPLSDFFPQSSISDIIPQDSQSPLYISLSGP